MTSAFTAIPKPACPHLQPRRYRERGRRSLLNPGEDWLGKRKTRNALGQTQGGRYLQVVYVRDPETR